MPRKYACVYGIYVHVCVVYICVCACVMFVHVYLYMSSAHVCTCMHTCVPVCSCDDSRHLITCTHIDTMAF